jgi:predicted TIM-barrel fold metal-dependent hydrolase
VLASGFVSHPFELIDAHTHTQPSAESTVLYLERNGLPSTPRQGDVPDLLDTMKRAGVSRTVIVSWLPAQALVEQAVAAGTDRDQAVAEVVTEWRALNAWATLAAQDHPEQISCYVGLEPVLMGPEVMRSEAELHLANGAMGLKVAPYSVWIPADDPRLELVWQLGTEFDVPVLSESGAHPEPYGEWGHPRYFHEVLRSYPNLRLQLAHLGIGAEDEMVRLVQAFPNVVTDTAMRLGPFFSPDYSPADTADLIRRIGTDRVLFGTNFPIVDQVQHAQALRELPLTEAELHQIGYANAQGFYRLPT